MEAINALAGRSVRKLHHGFYDDDLLELAVETLYGADHQLIVDGSYFVIESGTGIAAVGGWSWRRTIYGAHTADEPAAPVLDAAIEPARIRGFYVDPVYAGTGLGARLLRFCEQQARDAGFGCAALTSTEPAVQFYLRNGYVQRDTFVVPLLRGLTLPLVNMDKLL